MNEQNETVIVGGSQTGLAMSSYLTQLRREHVVLERGRIGEAWRSERWETYRSRSQPSIAEYLRVVRALLHGEEVEYTLNGVTKPIRFLHQGLNFFNVEQTVPIS